MNGPRKSELKQEDRNYINKENETAKKLTKEQMELMAHMAVVRGVQIADKKHEEFVESIQRNLSAALLFMGLSISQVRCVEGLIVELTEEDTEKLLDLKRIYRYEKEFDEFMKQTDKEIRKEIEKVLEKGMSKKQAIEDLKFKFPKLSKSMIISAYQKVKEEKEDIKNEEKVEAEDPRITAALRYIFEEDEDIKKLEENAEKIIENAKEIQCKEVKKDIQEVKAMENKLKVLAMTVEGENGTYKVCDKGVELQNQGLLMSFENVEQLDDFVNEYREVFKMIKA